MMLAPSAIQVFKHVSRGLWLEKSSPELVLRRLRLYRVASGVRIVLS